ncbi:MAG: S9 family peptidase, partial [Gammaproteobacteria bacterium]|nr:S9 family peptidase [Gammaproteobacteria bacterium]
MALNQKGNPMKNFLAVVVTALVAGCAVTGPPTADTAVTMDVPRYDAAAFFDTTTYVMTPASGLAFSSEDGSLLISSDASGVFNAYELPLDGSEPKGLTDSDSNAVFAVSWFPQDRRFLYTFDEGGNELNHVVVREADGTTTDLTPGENVKASFLDWSGDQQSFYLLTNERDQQHFDVYRYSASDYSRERVFRNNDGFTVTAISDDGRWLALERARTSADSDIYIVELHGKHLPPKLITGHEGNIEHSVLGFEPGSSVLVYSTDEHGEFRQAWTYDIDSGERAELVTADWDVSYVNHSPTGRYRVVGINADARTDVTITNRENQQTLSLPALPRGDLNNLRFNPEENKLALIVNASNSPSDIYI